FVRLEFFDFLRHFEHFPSFIIRKSCVKVVGHFDECIESDNIRSSESCRLWPTYNGTSESINFINVEIEFAHGVHGFHDSINSNTVCDEGRGVFTENRCFSEVKISVSHEKFYDLRISLLCRNDFE